MKLSLESTPELVTVSGAPARLWRGTTGKGTEVIAAIARVGVAIDQDAGELAAELQECTDGAGLDRYLVARQDLIDTAAVILRALTEIDQSTEQTETPMTPRDVRRLVLSIALYVGAVNDFLEKASPAPAGGAP